MPSSTPATPRSSGGGGGGGGGCCAGARRRWLVLSLACVVMFGVMFAYDTPAALERQMKARLHLSNTRFNAFYSGYSVPNVVLPFFGGLLVDTFGTGRTMAAFTLLVLAGQALFAAGFALHAYWAAVAGRVLFGLGGESLSVAQSTLLAVWFRGRETALSMGINLSMSRLGSVANDQVSPQVYTDHGLDAALWVALGFVGASAAAAATLAWVARGPPPPPPASAGGGEDGETASLLPNPAEDDGLSETGELGPDGEDDVEGGGGAGAGAGAVEKTFVERMRLDEVRRFSRSYWLLGASCVLSYAAILPFNNIAGDLLQERHGYSLQAADRLMAVPYTIAAMSTPLLGSAVDRFGRRAELLAGSSAVLAAAHFMLATTAVNPLVMLSMIGGGYAVYASAVWPAVALVVDKHQLGVAYGLTTALQNCSLAAVPLIVGSIRDWTGTYRSVELFFGSVSLLGVLVAIALRRDDRRHGFRLSRGTRAAAASALADAAGERDEADGL